MTAPSDAAQLLRQLGSGISPVAGAAPRPLAPTGEGAFTQLLQKAQAGELSSARPVTVSSDALRAGVQLSPDQLAVLSAAADKAEAAGLRTALVLIGEQAVTLDVGNRTILGPADASGGVLGGIDGVINLTDRSLGAPGQRPAPSVGFPGWSLTTPGLESALNPRDQGRGRAA